MKKIALNDLTKAELIRLLGLHAPCLRDRDIVRARHDTMIQKGKSMMDEAVEKMKELSECKPKPGSESIKNITDFLGWSKVFDRGMEIQAEANRLWD